MKKIVSLAFVSALLLSILFVTRFVTSVRADSKTIYVDASNAGDQLEDGSLEHPFNKIKEGVDAASPGDTVFVRNGTYYEWYITLKDDLSLIGENKYNTIIDGRQLGWILRIVYVHNVTVTGFTIRESSIGTAGILLAHSTKNNISNNIVKGHDTGIYSVFSNSNVIEGNRVSDSYAGIILSSVCKENKVSNNDVIGNTRGIDLSNYAHRNEVVNNRIVQNTYGISISLDGNSIFDNQIINNDVGIYEDLEPGPAQGYRVFHNNFKNNTLKVVLENSSINAWDNGLEGNYWSDYDGTDIDQDGIGDTSYVINQNNKDNHPLMGMFSDFPVAWEEETYHVTTICNSTISAFQFDKVNKTIMFNVTGEDETLGFCRIRIPKALTNYTSYTVLVDGVEPLMQKELPCSNSTHKYLYFTYLHSTHEVTILEAPPSPSFWVQGWFWAIIAVIGAGIALAAAVFFLRKRKPATPTAPPLP